MQKEKWLSEEDLQIAEKRRVAKGKGEKKRYSYLNAEFQRRAKRDKPSLVINVKKQRKTIEWERLDISSRKLDTKGTFQEKMGTKKDRNPTEAEDIKKRWRMHFDIWQN